MKDAHMSTERKERKETERKENTINVAFVGDGNVGKTVFLTRHSTGDFITVYEPSTDTKIVKIPFYTNEGVVTFNCRALNTMDKSYENMDAFVVMFDLTNKSTYDHVDDYVKEIQSLDKDVPIILCGNKCDLKNREVFAKNITKHRDLNLNAYFDISAKSNYNFEKPFLSILRELMGEHVHFTRPMTDEDIEAFNAIEFAQQQFTISVQQPIDWSHAVSHQVREDFFTPEQLKILRNEE